MYLFPVKEELWKEEDLWKDRKESKLGMRVMLGACQYLSTQEPKKRR